MKYLGIDYGTKKIGLAISDSHGTMAVGYGLMMTNDECVSKIKEIARIEEVDAFVIGHSVSGSGKENEVQKHINAFTEKLSSETALPVYQISELFSSMQAKWGVTKDIRRVPKSHRVTNKIKTNIAIDQGAAAILLQSYLDSHKNGV